MTNGSISRIGKDSSRDSSTNSRKAVIASAPIEPSAERLGKGSTLSPQTVELAKSARQNLAAALNALQQGEAVPDALMAVAEPIAEAMGALHRVERTQGTDLSQKDVAYTSVRAALNLLQELTISHPALDIVMEHVAGSLANTHALSRLQAAVPTLAPKSQEKAAPQPLAPVVPVAPQGTQMMPNSPAAIANTSPMPQPAPSPAAQPVPQPAAIPAPQPISAPQPAHAAPGFTPQSSPISQQASGTVRLQSAQVSAAMAGASTDPLPAPQAAPMQQQQHMHQQQAMHQHAVPQPVAMNHAVAQPPMGQYAAPPQPVMAQPAPQPKPVQGQSPTAASGNVVVELGAHSSSNFYKGLSGNDVIEHGGLFVSTYKIPKLGTTVALRVLLPGDYEFQATGVVQWIREALDGGADQSEPGFGARLTQISPEGRQLVYRYTRNREPMFYDDL